MSCAFYMSAWTRPGIGEAAKWRVLESPILFWRIVLNRRPLATVGTQMKHGWGTAEGVQAERRRGIGVGSRDRTQRTQRNCAPKPSDCPASDAGLPRESESTHPSSPNEMVPNRFADTVIVWKFLSSQLNVRSFRRAGRPALRRAGCPPPQGAGVRRCRGRETAIGSQQRLVA